MVRAGFAEELFHAGVWGFVCVCVPQRRSIGATARPIACFGIYAVGGRPILDSGVRGQPKRCAITPDSHGAPSERCLHAS